MKNYIKGIITGIMIGAVVCSIPALADTIDALFNNVRISVNGVDQIQWGENIKLSDGAETPASILYNGTTYLPMRKLGELSGNKIYWNGDSRTVGMTGAQKDIKAIAEKPDKNGNMWEYYTFKDNNDYSYLGVKDEARGYERAYRITGNVKTTDDEIFFIRFVDNSYPKTMYGEIVRLPFANDPDTQDGDIIRTMSYVSSGGILDNGYAYYMLHIPGNASHSELWVYNYITGDEAYYKTSAWDSLYITDVTETDNNIIFSTHNYYINHDMGEGSKTYNKATNTFVE